MVTIFRFGASIFTVWAVLLLGGVAAVAAAPSHPACQPEAELAATLADLDREFQLCRPNQECWEQKTARLKALRIKNPQSVHVHRAYQDAKRVSHSEELSNEYLDFVEENPKSAMAFYLHARLVQGDDLVAAVDDALSHDPDYPWAHLAGHVAYRQTKPPQPDRSWDHLKTFVETCTSQVEIALAYAGRSGPSEYWREKLPGWRKQLQGEDLQDSILSYHRLWGAEFNIYSPTEHSQVRARVAEDLERLKALEREPSVAYLGLARHGYELIGDTDQMAHIEALQAQIAPCETEVSIRLAEQWNEENLGSSHLTELNPEQAKKLYPQALAWTEKCPDSFFFWMSRFSALQHLDELSEAQLRAEIDGFLAMWENNKGSVGTARSPYVQVAGLLLARDLDLDKLPHLLASERDYVASRRRQNESMPEQMRARILESYKIQDVTLDLLEVQMDIAVDRLQEAEDGLARLDGQVRELSEMPEMGTRSAPSLAAQVQEQRAELALARGNPLDAVLALKRGASLLRPENPKQTDYRQRALELWKENGGTEVSFKRLPTGADEGGQGSVAKADLSSGTEEESTEEESADEPQSLDITSDWKEVADPLVPFQLQDLQGKVWTAEDLADKTVLVNLWATWCTPCRWELPHLQELADELRDQEDVLVLTLNVDRNVGLVLPYLEEEGFRFDVLLAERYIQEWQGGLSIPQNWVIDSKGVIRRTQSGFAPEAGEAWKQSAARAIKEVQATGKADN